MSDNIYINATTEAGYPEFVRSRTKPQPTLALDLHHATTGMTGESAEALDITKKLWIYNQTLMTVNKEGVTNMDHLMEEAGDTVFYIQMLCNHMGWTLQQLRDHNVKKLMRRYRTGYSDAEALARADKNEEKS